MSELSAKEEARLLSRVKVALKDTQRYIDRESERADDLRPANVQKTLNDYIAHAKKLQGYIDNPQTLVQLKTQFS